MSGFKKPSSDITFINSPFYIKYGIPVLLTFAATVIKLWLASYIGYKTPFLLYFGIVIITSRYFGERPAYLTTILSAACANILFTYPFNNISINEVSVSQFLVFFLECGLIINLSKALSKSLKIIDENDIRFKSLVEKSSEGIVTINIHGKFSYCSPSIQNIVGYTDEEFLNLPSWELIHPDEALEIKEQFFLLASHPGQSCIISHRMKHKNGEWIWIESKMTNLLNEQPINSIIANFSDITERILSDKMREDFISVASHELKTPLTSLKAYTQVLQNRFKNGTDETSFSIVNKIEHQVNRVVQMVTNLLDVTMLQENKMYLNMAFLDFNTLMTEVTDALQQTSKKHQLNLELAPLEKVFGDRDRLTQVITNLTSNAIKYSPNAATIDITSKIEDGQIVISVRDYGIGIPQDDLDKIFERFYRVDGAKMKFQGLGLGLFICHQIMEQHNGKIGVESEEGQGSTFWFSLPLAPA